MITSTQGYLTNPGNMWCIFYTKGINDLGQLTGNIFHLIFSVGFSAGVYDNNMNCTWTFRALPDHRMKLKFNSLRLNGTCLQDRLMVSAVGVQTNMNFKVV